MKSRVMPFTSVLGLSHSLSALVILAAMTGGCLSADLNGRPCGAPEDCVSGYVCDGATCIRDDGEDAGGGGRDGGPGPRGAADVGPDVAGGDGASDGGGKVDGDVEDAGGDDGASDVGDAGDGDGRVWTCGSYATQANGTCDCGCGADDAECGESYTLADCEIDWCVVNGGNPGTDHAKPEDPAVCAD